MTLLFLTESQPSPGVQVSGELVNTSVTFNPQSIMLSSFFITITDDSVALERDEEFSISFTTSSYTEGVMFGSSTQVTITDDDSKPGAVDFRPCFAY